MTQANEIQPAEGKAQSHRVFAWFTLLPIAIWIILGVVIGLAFWATDIYQPQLNESFVFMFAMSVGFFGFVIYAPGYLIFWLAALIGIILSFTAWKNSLTRFLRFLVWFDIVTMILSLIVIVASFMV